MGLPEKWRDGRGPLYPGSCDISYLLVEWDLGVRRTSESILFRSVAPSVAARVARTKKTIFMIYTKLCSSGLQYHVRTPDKYYLMNYYTSTYSVYAIRHFQLCHGHRLCSDRLAVLTILFASRTNQSTISIAVCRIFHAHFS